MRIQYKIIFYLICFIVSLFLIYIDLYEMYNAHNNKDIKIEKPVKGKVLKLSKCYKLTVQGSIYINSAGDTVEDHSSVVAYIPMDCEKRDTTKGFDLSKLVIVDTVGYAKVLLDRRRMDKYIEEQKLRVNL